MDIVGIDFGPTFQRRARRAWALRRRVSVALNDLRRAARDLADDVRFCRALLRCSPDPVSATLMRCLLEDCLDDAREDRRCIYIARRREYLRRNKTP